MEVYCLGNKPWQPCYVVRFNNTTVMLDCALDHSVLLHCLPLPLVYSPRLSNLPNWSPPQCQADASLGNVTKLFRENVGHIFVDSTPLVRLPETRLVDYSSIDVLLISSCFSMLALPFLTEKLGFHGKIYATEPTVHFGRQVMEELEHYLHRMPPNNASDDWRNEEIMKLLPDGVLKDSVDYFLWRELYSEENIKMAVSKITGVSYSQKISLFGCLEATAFSSGFCLGSCNWLIESDFAKVAYVSSSSTFTTHPCPMERTKLFSADALILCGLTNAPSANPDTMLGELCGRLASTLKNGGNVLIPCYPTGVLYDLLECLKAFLDNAGLSHVPVYFISPMAESSLAYSNIYAEWLCESKKSKVFVPEHPFPHAEFIKSGRLKHFPNIHGELGSVYQSPCVVFTGHPSLRCGDAVHFMEAWGPSSKNAVIFTEPDFEYLHALAPYQPLGMKAFYFPIDPRLNFLVANKLLKELAPHCLLTPESYLPSSAHTQKENLCLQPEMPYYGLSNGKMVSVPLKTMFQRVQIVPQLAEQLLPQEILPGVSVTSVSGLLSAKSNKHVLHPPPTGSITKRLWGEPSPEALVQALKELGILEVTMETTPEGQVLKILNGKATLIVTSGSTTIHNCSDEKLRGMLKEVVMRQLVQI